MCVRCALPFFLSFSVCVCISRERRENITNRRESWVVLSVISLPIGWILIASWTSTAVRHSSGSQTANKKLQILFEFFFFFFFFFEKIEEFFYFVDRKINSIFVDTFDVLVSIYCMCVCVWDFLNVVCVVGCSWLGWTLTSSFFFSTKNNQNNQRDLFLFFFFCLFCTRTCVRFGIIRYPKKLKFSWKNEQRNLIWMTSIVKFESNWIGFWFFFFFWRNSCVWKKTNKHHGSRRHIESS